MSETNPHIANNKLAFASVYGNRKKTPAEGWNLELRNVDVTNGFFLYSLLLEKPTAAVLAFAFLLLLFVPPARRHLSSAYLRMRICTDVSRPINLQQSQIAKRKS
ncbi:hypothetical protein B0H17DRAFT_1203494 [Mycena rosella]|uniref:Uncharacterized protein n=1 Tax=Mycena rosella TaxID=1033263 RepID=A0AAD7GGB2_MYCRO|nr:hypothetical protein B0H17DRAFT_1203494 [Mycena rosella]